jgi:hypothetical protein
MLPGCSAEAAPARRDSRPLRIKCAAVSDWTPVDLLPGLYAGLLAWLVTAAVRRWYDRVPARALAAFVAVVLVALGPALFGGKVLLPLDNLRGHVPFTALPPTEPHGNLLQGDLVELVAPSLAAGRDIWLTGCWPLWNGLVGAGMPLLADPQAQALQPLALAALPLPVPRAAGVSAALRLWTALLFTFLLLSAQRLGEGPALCGAFAFALGGFLMLWLGWPLANSAALLPVVLYAIVRCDRHGGRRDRVLLALAFACLLLGGHPETVLYAGAFSLLFLLARLRQRPARPASERRGLLRATLPALLLGAGLAAPALLATADYLPQSLRAARLRQPPAPAAPISAGTAPAPALPAAPRRPAEDLLSSPPRPAEAQLSSPPRPADGLLSAPAPPAGGFLKGWRGLGGPGDVGGLGGLALRWLPIAAPNAYGNSRFLYYWGARNTNEDAGGFAGTATLLAALLALGARRRLPQERLALGCAGVCLLALAVPGLAGGRLLLLVAFCLSYAGACTWERWCRGEVGRLSVLIAGGALAAVIVWGYLAHPDPADPGRLALLRMGWLRWQLRFLLAAMLLAAAVPRRWRRPAAFAAAGLAAAELLLAHLPANPPAPQQLAFPPSVPLAFLFDHRAEGRMAGLGRALPPNLASVYHLADARIYNPMAPAAYLDYLAPLIASWWGELPLLGAPESPLYGRLGVRFLLAAPGERLPPPWQLALADGAGWVYRRPRTQAVFRLADEKGAGTALSPDTQAALASPVSSADAQAASLLAGEKGPQAVPHPDQDPAALPAPPEEPDRRLELMRYDAARYSFRTAGVEAGSRLVSSLYQDGGWRLLVDGRRQPLGRLDGPFAGAPVPPGGHRLDLLYRPRGFVLGCALAALAAAALAAVGLSPHFTPLREAGGRRPAARDPARRP